MPMKRHGCMRPMWEQENDRDDHHTSERVYEDPAYPIERMTWDHIEVISLHRRYVPCSHGSTVRCAADFTARDGAAERLYNDYGEPKLYGAQSWVYSVLPCRSHESEM